MNTMLEVNITMSEVYNTWLMSMASLNTQKKYQSSVTMFSNMVFGKEPKDINADDLQNIRYRDTITKFVQPLKDKGVKDSTIKAHLTAMRQLIKMMNRDHIYSEEVDYNDLLSNVLNVDTLKTNDREHHETLSIKELEELKAWFQNKKYRSDDVLIGQKYAMLSSFLYATAIRITAIFNIKWSDFTITNSPYGGNWAILKAKDKGQKINEKPIALDYFDHLKEVLYKGKNNDYVFGDLSQVSFTRYLKQFSEVINKNITPHSFKRGAATTLYAETHDLLLVRDFCDHTDVSITQQYIDQVEDPNKSGSARFTTSYDFSKIDSLSREELLQLIHSERELEVKAFNFGKQIKAI